jgi:GntR family transcriptional regulator
MPPLQCHLDRHSGVPVYRQIVDQVRFQVAAGTLEVGAEMPSTRAIAADHGVNPMTVSKAYSELERLGVIERRPGKPNVVAARAPDARKADESDQLERALAPAVAAIRQLGVDPEVAIGVLRNLLENS